jgi:hypothetical protein
METSAVMAGFERSVKDLLARKDLSGLMRSPGMGRLRAAIPSG